MSTLSAEEKALTAAEELAADGIPVTARAVRERSGVRMAVAATVAKEWKEQQATETQSTPMPPEVQARATGLWNVALKAANDSFDADRQAWEARIQSLENEQTKLQNDIDSLEEELEEQATELARKDERIAKLEKQVEAEKSRADRAEGKNEVLSQENGRLILERDAAREENKEDKKSKPKG